jgi:hypothetical protein
VSYRTGSQDTLAIFEFETSLGSHPAHSFKLFTEEVDTIRPEGHIIEIRYDVLNTSDTRMG